MCWKNNSNCVKPQKVCILKTFNELRALKWNTSHSSELFVEIWRGGRGQPGESAIITAHNIVSRLQHHCAGTSEIGGKVEPTLSVIATASCSVSFE